MYVLLYIYMWIHEEAFYPYIKWYFLVPKTFVNNKRIEVQLSNIKRRQLLYRINSADLFLTRRRGSFFWFRITWPINSNLGLFPFLSTLTCFLIRISTFALVLRLLYVFPHHKNKFFLHMVSVRVHVSVHDVRNILIVQVIVLCCDHMLCLFLNKSVHACYTLVCILWLISFDLPRSLPRHFQFLEWFILWFDILIFNASPALIIAFANFIIKTIWTVSKLKCQIQSTYS